MRDFSRGRRADFYVVLSGWRYGEVAAHARQRRWTAVTAQWRPSYST
jgi:hypothetical protein